MDKKEDTVPDVRSLGPIKNPKKERQLLINRICAQIEKMEENTYQNIRSYIRSNDVEEGRPTYLKICDKSGEDDRGDVERVNKVLTGLFQKLLNILIDLGGEGASTKEIAILDDVILKPRMRTVNFLQS